METAVLSARGILAIVLIVAAVGKLLDLPGSRRAVRAFGIPASTAIVAGTVLPFVELAIGAGLLLRPSAQWAGLAALMLLLVFVGGISQAMARGERPDCNCFGALHSARAGWGALARNVVLAGVALFVVMRGPGPSVTAWIADRSAAELVAIAIGAALIGLLPLARKLWLENRALRSQVESLSEVVSKTPAGLPVGAMAPDFSVPGEDGRTMTLESLLGRGHPVALIFVRAGCGASEIIAPEAARWRESMSEHLTIGLVGRSGILRYREGPHPMLTDAVENDPQLKQELDEVRPVYGAYHLNATPSAVIVTPEGTIASATVHGRPAIEALIRVTLARTTRLGSPSKPSRSAA